MLLLETPDMSQYLKTWSYLIISVIILIIMFTSRLGQVRSSRRDRRWAWRGWARTAVHAPLGRIAGTSEKLSSWSVWLLWSSSFWSSFSWSDCCCHFWKIIISIIIIATIVIIIIIIFLIIHLANLERLAVFSDVFACRASNCIWYKIILYLYLPAELCSSHTSFPPWKYFVFVRRDILRWT